ncbi:MOSC N-terminal beta barrel domain-containing protein [Saccharopolyspora indica]|uniref:MOSC domain-containing protein n=1 Tax=Saccharopolyspora indica TaxID=1229659 RepID=UPI0022EACECA|nr:MOSC N-terminal beta barrel domain-containing protein [Saccharopolyspora indica]MDA3650217.1 MOSC N-terminal beta barrel domain-containing protein [Saccharopolyspora indica]
MALGTVAELHRWPVKSLRGEPVRAARFDHRGMAGDRAHALRDERPTRAGNVLTVRQNPAMLGWGAAYGETADPAEPPQLHAPDGAIWNWQDPELGDALAESLGIPLSLRAADGQQDRGPTVLVTFEASRAELGEELGAEVDLRRFRTNLHVEADLPAFAEELWEPGATLTAGAVELEVTGDHAGPCIRCAVPSWDAAGRERWRDLQTHLIGRHDNKFGVIMRVTAPGEIRLGDPVTTS